MVQPTALPPISRFTQGSRFPVTIRAEVEIAAPRAAVWAVLTDLARYDSWNPFTPRVRGELQEGAAVTLEVHMLRPRPLTQVEYVNSVVEGRRLCWGAQVGGAWLLTANRVQTLEDLGCERTRYVSEDRLSGWLTPLVIRLYGPAMGRGFDAMAQALKLRVEAGGMS